MNAVPRRRLDVLPDDKGPTNASSANAAPFPNFRRHYDAGPGEKWQVEIVKRLTTLLQFQPDWDGYGTPALSLDAGMFVLTVLQGVMMPRTPIPQIVLSSEGGIQVEWHERGIDLEFHITAPYQGEYWYEDKTTGHSDAADIKDDLSNLQRWVRVLTSR